MSVAALAAEGRATELAGIGKTLQDKVVALLETGDIPSAVKLRDRFPAGLSRSPACPAWDPSGRACCTTSWGSTRRRPCGPPSSRGACGEVRGFGPKAQANILAALDARAGDRAPARVLLDRALAVAEPLVEALRAHPACERVELAGSARRGDRHRQGPRRDRHRHRPRGAGRGGGRSWTSSSRCSPRGEAGARLTTHAGPAGGPADRRARPVRQPAPALHRLQAAQRGAAPGGRAPRAARVRVRDPRRRRLEHDARCATEAEVYERLGLRVHRARAAREPRRAGGGRGGRAAGADRGGRPARRPALAHVRLGRAQHDRRDGGGPRASAATSTWRSPTTARRWASATTSPPTSCERQIERVREVNERVDGFELLAGSEVNVLPDGGLDYDDDLLAELDWVIASVHSSFRVGRGGDDRAHPQRGRAPLRGRDRPPDRAHDRPPPSGYRWTSSG